MGKPNFKPSTIWTGDNLPILRGMNSKCVDLIYLDPPFNSKRMYEAPIGGHSKGASFRDKWTLNDVKKEYIDQLQFKNKELYRIIQSSLSDSNKAYLLFMSVRLREMQRILKDSGSIYLHCDPTMSHWLKILMDCIFGRKHFRNEIIWQYRTGGISKKHYARKHDVILFYAGSEANFNLPREESRDLNRFNLIDEEGRYYYEKAGNRYYADEGVAVADVWDISPVRHQGREYTGYPTQKPLALLERILLGSSEKGDLIFDPFCGCATTLVSADRLERNWVGIDVSEKAIELVNERIKYDREDEDSLWRGVHKGRWTGAIERIDIPIRTDFGKLPPIKNHKKALYGEQEGNCAGCDQHFNIQNLEIDHIVAKNSGGTDHKDNLQLLCGSCNRIKGDRGMEYLTAKLK